MGTPGSWIRVVLNDQKTTVLFLVAVSKQSRDISCLVVQNLVVFTRSL